MPGGALIRFEGVRQPLALKGCAALMPAIDRVLAAWPHDITVGGAARLGPRAHRVALSFDGEGYHLESPWLEEPIRHRDPVNTVCDLVVQLVNAFVATHPTGLCLHSAAVRLGGRLVVFPNVYRGGKSLLVAHLASLGAEVFADDVIPIGGQANHGFALGIAPRLRLPLPKRLAPGFESFVKTHGGPSSGRYLYLDPEPGLLAPFGATAPIGAFVLLDRRGDGPPGLTPLPRAEALGRVIERNFARRPPARRIFERLERIVMRTPSYRIAYGDPGHAACRLVARFADWSDDRPTERRRPRARIAAGTGPAPRPGRATGPLRPRPRIREKRIGDALFLVDEESDSIHYLNALAATVWRLIGEGVQEAEMADLIAAAFPKIARARITRDVARLIAGLIRRGVLDRHG